MYDVRWLSRVALDGLDDLLPAVRRAFDNDPDNDRLAWVYGASPRAAIVGLAFASVIVGALWARFGLDLGVNDYIHWPAVAVGLIFAAILRHYLFDSGKAGPGDFPWLAASLVPAILLLAATVTLERIYAFARGADETLFAMLTNAFAAALGVAAAVTIAVAALCYSRNWVAAMRDLAVRLLVFKIMVWVTTLLILDIGIIGPIVSGILSGILDISVPDWISDLIDQVSYFGLMSIIYLAVIGATWKVCHESFPELLETGQVDVLGTIAAMSRDPEKRARRDANRAEKAERKLARRRQKQQRKQR